MLDECDEERGGSDSRSDNERSTQALYDRLMKAKKESKEATEEICPKVHETKTI